MIIKSKPFTLFARRPKVTAISVASSSATITEIGGTYRINPTFTPSTSSDTVTYTSSNTTIATVDSNGVVTALKQGSATITIALKSNSSVKATVAITVSPSIDKITLSNTSYTFEAVNKTKLITASLSASLAKQSITWTSSNTAIATVDSNGLITSKGVGTCTITAKAGSTSATCSVTVQQYATGVSLSSTNSTINVGGTVKLTATVTPSNATNKNVTWSSSNTSVATVSGGTVTGVSGGTCTITAKSNSNNLIEATATITVNVPATGITLSQSSLSFTGAKENKQLIAVVTPLNATNGTVTWKSSNTSVATVDSNGNVTSVGKGTCTITATNAQGHSATVSVVVGINVENLYIDKSNIILTSIGQTSTITATIVPSNTGITPTWTSSDTNVATVTNGVVKAIKDGTALITVSAGDKQSKIFVSVETTAPTITLNKTSHTTTTIGQTFTLTPTLTPNTSLASFTFSSTNANVATVSTNGLVKIIGIGTCQIKVSAKGVTAICNITVNPINVTSVTLNATSCSFSQLNQTFQIRPTIAPSNASYKDLAYNITTSNAGFTVSKDGLVTCTGILGGTIEVVAHNGVKATFKVNISGMNIAVGDYSERLASLRKAMQSANEKIAQAKVNTAETNLQTQITNLKNSVNKELGELESAFVDIRDNVLDGIEDGILTEVEKARIQASLDSIKNEKADVDAQYTELYNNTYLVDSGGYKPKTNLKTSYDNYITRYNNLVSNIENLLNIDDKINQTHINQYANQLDNCINAYKTFKKYATQAIDAIAQRKADLLYSNSVNYTDAKIKVESDRITSAVTSVNQVNNKIINLSSSVEILAGQINSKVEANGVSSIIQQNPESVRIAFNGISSGMTVTKSGIQLKTSGLVHTVLQNGRLEVMKKDETTRLGFVGRSSWAESNTQGMFINVETGCTFALGVNHVMGFAYSMNTVTVGSTGVTITPGVNVLGNLNMHNYSISKVGAIYTPKVTIGSNYVEAPVLNATSQVKAETVHVYNWCQAKKFTTYTSATIQTRSGETKNVSVEKTCVDTLTANTEYIGTANVEDGIAIVELPPTLTSLGVSYVLQITPIGDKKIYVSSKDRESFTVKGDDCTFDYIVKVILPKVPDRLRSNLYEKNTSKQVPYVEKEIGIKVTGIE